jgi:predicted Zn-dependent protease
MRGKEKILSTLNSIIKKSEADQTESVYIGSESGLTRYANSFIHQNVFEANTRIYFRVALGKKLGVAVTNSFVKEDLLKTLKNAIEIAKNQKDNPYFESLPKKQKTLKPKTYFKKTAEFSPKQRAQEVKKVFEKAAKHNLTVAGSYSTGESELAVINSLGVSTYQPTSSAAINMIVMSDNSSGYSDDLNRDVTKIEVESLADVAIQKCLDSKNPQSLEPGEYDVILEPVAVGNLVEWMNFIGFNSKSFQEETSFLSGRIGQKIMNEKITLYDDGNDEKGIAFPFDFEGVPKKKVFFVKNGVAQGVVYDSITANREKKKTTGHALPPDSPDRAMALNIFIKAGDSSVKKMIESTSKGLLITRFHYINGLLDTTNALMTGMTRDGTFLVENGKVKGGVKNLRFTETMLKAFSNVSQISKERKLINSWWADIGCIVAPAMLIKNFKFTGKTEF